MSQTLPRAPATRAPRVFSAFGRVGAFVRAHPRQSALVGAVALYLGFACYLTWPLVTDLTHRLYGEAGDPYGSIAFYRTLVEHNQNPFLPGTIAQFGAPTGIPIPWPRDIASAPSILILYLLSAAFGAAAARSLYTLAGYTLTGLVTFLFARRLTGNTWVAVIVGWVYAFYPYAVINGQAHLDYIQGWLLMLALWRLIELTWHASPRNGLLAGLAVALCMWWTPYFILLGSLIYAVVTVLAVTSAWRAGRLRTIAAPQLIAAAIPGALAVVLGVLSTVGQGEGIGVVTNPIQALDFYAARPLEYLLPDVHNPLLGAATRPILAKYPLHGSNIETTLYLGITTMLLALVAIAALVRRRLPPRIARVSLALALIGAIAAVASMPPEARILGVSVPFPAHFIALLTTTWRVYARFVMVVMLAVTLLAAIGLERLKCACGPRARVALLALATVLIPFDLWTPQHSHVTKLTTPGIYRTLARLPYGIVAEYPLAPNAFNKYADSFHQSAYRKPIIGGYLKGSYQEHLAFSLAVLSDPQTAPRLAALGVRYVVLDSQPARWPPWPAPGKPGAGLRLIASEPYAKLYLVTAAPSSPALAGAGEGFGEAVGTNAGSFNVLESPHGTIDVVGACTRCAGVLTMTLGNFASGHVVTVADADGQILRELDLAGQTRVQIPLRFSKHTELELTATPAPQPISHAPGAPSASIGVADLEFRR